jgi:hypothetical protein
MDAFGYILAGNARTAPADFYPSLIGVSEDQRSAGRADPYFNRIDVTDRRITEIAVSPYVTYDSLPLEHRDPILAVKGPGGNYYIPRSELEEIAAANQDDDTFALLAKLGRR